jgi:biopolymer transport protein ExbD/biopolymer transport protein TolR
VDKTVFVKSDARARYGIVEDVVDNVRAAGVDQIGLITELIPVKNKNSATPINAGGQ